MAQRRWADLEPWQRRLIVVGGTVELMAKIAMLVDLSRRPAELVRGPKVIWRVAAFVNGLGPLAYFIGGRRRG